MLLNPNAGARQGRRVFQRVVPLFKAAGIRLTVRETKRPAHAHVMAAGLMAEQLRAIDGACTDDVMGLSGLVRLFRESKGSWKLLFVSIKDLQPKHRQPTICPPWLAAWYHCLAFHLSNGCRHCVRWR